MVEIYAICDPDDMSVRYIGKSVNSRVRFKSHLADRRWNTPLYVWLMSLAASNKMPVLRVLGECPCENWPSFERFVIAAARQLGCDLLNVAPGGNEPYCPTATRARNGIQNAKARVSTPAKKRMYERKRAIGLALRQGYVSEQTKEKLRYLARLRPELFGAWENI